MFRTTLFLCLLSCLAQAQGVNCALLGTLDPQANYNDIWGYVAPNGDEYALVGCQDGTSVIDVSDPANPVERAFLPGPVSVWRDIRTYGTYAYVVTEAAAGMQVIDMTSPNAPTLVGVAGASHFGNAHNISLDLGTGHIYIVGAGGGAGNPVFDASANPTDPPLIGNALPAAAGNPNSTYFHDLQVENGFAYGSMIYNGDLRIMSTSGLPLPVLSDTPTPGNFTHQAWPNAAGTVCVTCDEVGGGVVKFWDISNKASPQPLGQFTPNPSSTPHNAFIRGDFCHVSWYTEGYRCIDISDPNNPTEIASYDTWPAAGAGFDGAWGCYPFLPSGNVLVSDRTTGLYIVKPNLGGVQILHDPLTNTTDENNPYTVTCTASSSTSSLQSVSVVYRLDNGPTVTVPMSPTGVAFEYSADIPAQTAPTNVFYRINAVDSSGPTNEPSQGDHRFLVGTLARVWFDDMEVDRGWTHGATQNTDDWQRGIPNGLSGTSGGLGWADPGSAFSGNSIWGTDLGGAGFNGSYDNNASTWFESPAISTNSRQGLRLRYRRWIGLAGGDTASVLVNGVVVDSLPPNTLDTDWQWIEHDISAIANTATSLTLRFELNSDATQVSAGWNLDDVEVYVDSDCTPPEYYGDGTLGSSGIGPVLIQTTPALLGSASSIVGTGLLGGSTNFLVMGLQPDNIQVFGITGLVDNSSALWLFSIASGTPGVPGVGVTSFTVPVPNNPGLDGIDLYNQILVVDSGSPGGFFAATRGMRYRTCIF